MSLSFDDILFKVFKEIFTQKVVVYNRNPIETVFEKKPEKNFVSWQSQHSQFPAGHRHILEIDEYFVFIVEINFLKPSVDVYLFFNKEKIENGQSTVFETIVKMKLIGNMHNKISEFVLNQYRLNSPELFIQGNLELFCYSESEPLAHQNISFDKLYESEYKLDTKEFLFLQERCNLFLKRQVILQLL